MERDCSRKSSSRALSAPNDGPSQINDMDARIWQQLPDETMILILSKLPFRSYCRLRTVCKLWNEQSQSPIFQAKWNRFPSQAPFSIVSLGRCEGVEGYAIYNPVSHLWHHLSPKIFAPKNCADASLLSSGGGLMLLKGSDREAARILYLVNPMTKSERELPPLPGCKDSHMIHYAKLDWCYERDTYNIFVMDRVQVVEQDDENEWGISIYLEGQMYDSVLDTWQTTGFLPLSRSRLPCEVPCLDIVSAVYHNSYIYCLVHGCFDDIYSVFRCPHTLGQHVEVGAGEDLWDPIEIGDLPEYVTYSHLIDDSGYLHLAGISESGNPHLWVLDQEKRIWVKFRTVLQQLPRELSYKYESSFVARGECRWFPLNYVVKGHEHFLLTWDILNFKWWFLPESPFGEFARETSTVHLVDFLYLAQELSQINDKYHTPTMDFVEWKFLQTAPRPLLVHFEPRFDVVL